MFFKYKIGDIVEYRKPKSATSLDEVLIITSRSFKKNHKDWVSHNYYDGKSFYLTSEPDSKSKKLEPIPDPLVRSKDVREKYLHPLDPERINIEGLEEYLKSIPDRD